MLICSICKERVKLLDYYGLSDGKCCANCWHIGSTSSMIPKKTSVSDIKNGILYKKVWNDFVNEMEIYFENEYRQIGLEFDRFDSNIKNAVKADYVGNEYITVFQNTLYFIEGWSHYRLRYSEAEVRAKIAKREKVELEKINIFKVPVENIKYFYKDGDIQYTTKLSGGGGGGASISGAIVGGLIAGEVGAIIGSRTPIDPITSSVQVHDTSKSFLVYYDNGELITDDFDSHDVYNYLLKRITHKDLQSVQLQLNSEHSNTTSSYSSIEEIRKYKELMDEGIITQEEFDAKKKQLLGI